MMVNDDAALRRILQTCRVIAVVGLSPKPDRPSHGVAKYLLEHGYCIVPVHPLAEEILGQKCYPDLGSIPGKVDLVDVFRKPEDVMPIAQQAIRIRAQCLWLQLGIVNQPAADQAAEAGLDVVVDRCVKIEYQRLFGGRMLADVSSA